MNYFRPSTRLARHPIAGGTCWIDPCAVNRLDAFKHPRAIRDLVDAVTGDTSLPQQVLQDNRRTQVLAVTWNRKRWVVKRYKPRVGAREFHHPLCRSPAWREWLGACWLQQSGRRVYSIVAMSSRSSWPQCAQTLIYPFVEGTNLSAWLKQFPPSASGPSSYLPVRLAIAREIGRQIGLIAAAGLVSLEYRARNLIIDKKCAGGQAEPVMIDTARLKRSRSNHQAQRMLAVFTSHDGVRRKVSPREYLTCLGSLLKTDTALASKLHMRPSSLARSVEALLIKQHATHRRV